jgi:magnesium transporter
MLTAFSCETGRPARLVDVSNVAALSKAVWIDLQDPTEDEERLIKAATGATVPTRAAVSEIENSSRLNIRDGVLYLTTPMVSMADGPRGVSVGFVLSSDRLITVRFASIPVFDAFTARLTNDPPAKGSGAHVMLGILEGLVDREADVLENAQLELDNISHRVFALGGKSKTGRKIEDRMLRATLAELGHIGDLLTHIREAQLGAARLLPFIEANTTDWLPAELKPRIGALTRDIESVNDFDRSLSDKLQFLLDATLGFINIAQNDVMKVMTIASVVGIPPVLVAGIYGMNFKNMPEYDWAWGYQFGWTLIILTTLIPLGLFWWRKWI